MNFLNTLFPKRNRDGLAGSDAQLVKLGRKLRTFDIETVAPYDNKGVVAFLKADKMSKLSSAQIRVFLMLRDNPEPEGFTARHIAEWLEMTPNSVRSCLSVLKREGYALHSKVEQRDSRGQKVIAWVYDPGCPWADDDLLYWEFGKL
ncbi:MAG: hypothetical protein KDE63_07980 [Novosphingobium sp.]|nr:hypothetical protein [Novosphingobium sp.]